MKFWSRIVLLSLCFWSQSGICDTPADIQILFVVQHLTQLSDYQKSLLMELQLTGKYHWIPTDLEFKDASLPTRFEQIRPLGDQLQCDTAVWIDEVSPETALVQVLAMAPGRMSLRSVEVNLQTEAAADTAIVVDELLAQTDIETATPEPPPPAHAAATPPTDTPIQQTPADHETEKNTGPNYLLFATMETDVSVYNPFGVMFGGGLDGCVQGSGGFGGCLLRWASGERDRHISDIDVSQFQFRPGLAVYFSKRVSRFALGPELCLFPVLQYVKVEPAGFDAEREIYLNGIIALSGQGRWFIGKRLVLQLRLGAVLWFRTLTFTRQSTAGTLFETPLVSPLVAVSLGTVF